MKKKRTTLWGANRLTIFLVACLVLGAASAVFGAELPPEVSINPDAGCGGWLSGGWLDVKSHLETGEEVVFCVDTGAPFTIVDDSLLPQLGKRVGAMRLNFVGRKPQIAGIYKAPKLLLGNVPLSNCGFVACMHLPKKFKKHCQGVLGIDCLQDYCIQLDFVAGKMRFLDATATNAAAWGKMYPLTFSKTGPDKHLIQPFIHQAGFFGDNTNLLIDTGCHADGLVYKEKWGTVLGTWLLSLFQCGRFHSGVWDGEKYSDIEVAPVDHVNVLGLRFLARHLVTLDFPNQKMYLKQTSVGPLKIRKPSPN